MRNFVLIGCVAAGALLSVAVGYSGIIPDQLRSWRWVDAEPAEPGYLDNAPLTEADRHRLSEIATLLHPEHGGDLTVIRAIQAGHRSTLTRRDFELLHQDIRRARAAYPDVDPDKLLLGGWAQVDLSARIPMSASRSLNASGSRGGDGVWYLDGPVYKSYVAPEYPERASPEETARFHAALRERWRGVQLARTEVRWSSVGSKERLTVNCWEAECSVTHAEEPTGQEHSWTFPFVAAEWVDDPRTLPEIRALPSFAGATERIIDRARPGVVEFRKTAPATGDSVPYYPGMTLMPGQSTTLEVIVR
jgi:hypothetical protein